MSGGQALTEEAAEQAVIWLRAYAAEVRRAALDMFEIRSCVETVRVGAAVARYFGVAFEPIAVQVVFGTPDWWDWPDDDKANAPGHSVGIVGSGRQDEARNFWDGHLIGLVAGRVAVDFSADQFSRPAQGIVIDGPIVFAASRAQLAAGIALRNSHLGFRYKAIDDQSWRRMPAWTQRPRLIRRVAGTAIRALQEDV